MLKEETSSMACDQVYEARKETPWLKRFLKLASIALYEELAMPVIKPVEANSQALSGSVSPHPE